MTRAAGTERNVTDTRRLPGRPVPTNGVMRCCARWRASPVIAYAEPGGGTSFCTRPPTRNSIGWGSLNSESLVKHRIAGPNTAASVCQLMPWPGRYSLIMHLISDQNPPEACREARGQVCQEPGHRRAGRDVAAPVVVCVAKFEEFGCTRRPQGPAPTVVNARASISARSAACSAASRSGPVSARPWIRHVPASVLGEAVAIALLLCLLSPAFNYPCRR